MIFGDERRDEITEFYGCFAARRRTPVFYEKKERGWKTRALTDACGPGRNMKIGVVGIVLRENRETAARVQALLSEYAPIIVGRMGVPDHAHKINTISLIVRGSNEQISALTGKLGRLNDVSVKSAVTAVEVPEDENCAPAVD